jgi:hypothetical protein
MTLDQKEVHLRDAAHAYLQGNITRREFQNAVAETVEIESEPPHGVLTLNDIKRVVMEGTVAQKQRILSELRQCDRGHIYTSEVLVVGSNLADPGPKCPYCVLRGRVSK